MNRAILIVLGIIFGTSHASESVSFSNQYESLIKKVEDAETTVDMTDTAAALLQFCREELKQRVTAKRSDLKGSALSKFEKQQKSWEKRQSWFAKESSNPGTIAPVESLLKRSDACKKRVESLK